MVKTNIKVLFKDTIKKLKKYWSRVYYLVLRIKPIVPVFRPLICIGCKYNTRKVISFIVTYNTGITQAGLPYLSDYTDQFANSFILLVSGPLVMSKFFGSVNEFYSHNKPRQSDLALDKFCVNQCGWLQICTTVSMVITITNFGNCFIMWLIDTTIK